MRAVVQRVSSSKVTVDENTIGQINKGLLVLLGVTHDDKSSDVDYMIDKILNIGGELLVVSQFTLYGDCRKGRRPGFSNAARPELANNLYEEFVKKAKDKGVTVGTGQFAAHMMVELTNDGPVTILLDSSKSF